MLKGTPTTLTGVGVPAGSRPCSCVRRKIAQKCALLPLRPWGHKYPVCLAGVSPETGNRAFPGECPPCGRPHVTCLTLAPGLQGCSALLAGTLLSVICVAHRFPSLLTAGWASRDLAESLELSAAMARSVSHGPAWQRVLCGC